MTSAFLDAGDLQRMDREATLTEQAPRALPASDRSPPEDNLVLQDEPEEDGFDLLLEGILEALRRRL